MKDGIQYILYNLPEEQGEVQVVVENETLWCTQKAMAQLFGVGVPAISKHLKNIFDEGELIREVVVSKMEITTPLQKSASGMLDLVCSFIVRNLLFSISFLHFCELKVMHSATMGLQNQLLLDLYKDNASVFTM